MENYLDAHKRVVFDATNTSKNPFEQQIIN